MVSDEWLIMNKTCYSLMLGGVLPARVCDALPPGFEPVTRIRGLYQTRPQAVRLRAIGSNLMGSASQTRASNTPLNSSY